MTDESPEQPESREDQAAAPAKLTYRITRISLLAIVVVVLGVTPIAWVRPWLLVMYLLPLILLIWVLRLRTVVTSETVATRTLFGSRQVRWDDISSFRLHERKWLRAVLTSGKEIQLPAVRVRDLPRLSELSGGRLTDPASASEDDGPGEPEESSGEQSST